MMRVALRMAVSAPAKALYGLCSDVKHRLNVMLCYACIEAIMEMSMENEGTIHCH